MNEKFWHDIYQKTFNPWEYHGADESIPEKLRPQNSSDNSNELENSWKKDYHTQTEMTMEDWLLFILEHRRPDTSELFWDIFKQVVDDLLADDYKSKVKSLVSFPIIPRIKRYELIKDYNFSDKRSIERYAEIVFDWLSFLDVNLFSIEELGEFNNGEFLFLLKPKNKERLLLLKSLINVVDDDFRNASKKGIAYELTYRHNFIGIKGATAGNWLHKVRDNSSSQILFEALFESESGQIKKEEIKRGDEIYRFFNDLLKDMKFVGNYGKLFIPSKGHDFVTLRKIITYEDLEKADLEYLSPDDLIKKMKKK